jgi:SAM-dependent methyltransferase
VSDGPRRQPPTSASTDALRDRWDQRWSSAADKTAPVTLLIDRKDLVPRRGTALDLACGLSGSALELARIGLDVSAWDLSSVAIARLRAAAAVEGLRIDARVRDVQAEPPGPASFDLICVVHFLDRGLAPALAAALRPGGRLFFQTWVGEQRGGRGPSSPDYRLRPGELPGLFPTLIVRHYRECGTPSSGFHDQAQLIAESPAG